MANGSFLVVQDQFLQFEIIYGVDIIAPEINNNVIIDQVFCAAGLNCVQMANWIASYYYSPVYESWVEHIVKDRSAGRNGEIMPMCDDEILELKLRY